MLNWFTITRVGKILVILQSAASLALLGTVAFGIYPNRNNVNTPVEGKSAIQRLDERIKALADGRDRAETRWREAFAVLQTNEAMRPLRQQQYAYKLAVARTGLDQSGQRVQDPVTAVEYDQNGNLKLAGPQALQNRGENLRSYIEMVGILDQFHRTQPMLGLIPQKQQDIKDLISQYDQLTLAILGDGGANRGLRKERELQEDLKAKTIAQQEYTKPFLANYYSEAVLLLQRQNSLMNRRQELEKVGLAAGGRPSK